jgi:hypothetical protein
MDNRIEGIIDTYKLSIGQRFKEGKYVNYGIIEGFRIRNGKASIIYRESTVRIEGMKKAQNVAEMGGHKFKDIIENIIR